MTKRTIIATVLGIAVVVLVVALVVRSIALDQFVSFETAPPPSVVKAPAVVPPPHAQSGFLYGRITVDGDAYEGRLRWGRDQEAFWGDFFDGAKLDNRWAVHAPVEPADQPDKIEIFGFEFGGPDRSHLRRQFMALFGDIARVDVRFKEVQVTLKSGTKVTLDRFSAGDIDDGVRVWDGRRGVVDLDSRQIRTIEFLPTPGLAGAPGRLHGVVHTPQGQFSGFIQWNQQDSVSTDSLDGQSGGDEVSLRYDTIRSIARHSRESARVTLQDGKEMVLSQTAEVGRRHRGIYVEDARYGRVLISWNMFERVDFTPGGSTGAAYSDYRAGRQLSGIVHTRDGRQLSGRLVYDFDESETTETLETASMGIDYTIPLVLVDRIVPPGREEATGRVVLLDGRELPVERSGDLAERNAGMLIFVEGHARPEYVPWAEVAQIEFDRPAAPANTEIR